MWIFFKCRWLRRQMYWDTSVTRYINVVIASVLSEWNHAHSVDIIVLRLVRNIPYYYSRWTRNWTRTSSTSSHRPFSFTRPVSIQRFVSHSTIPVFHVSPRSAFGSAKGSRTPQSLSPLCADQRAIESRYSPRWRSMRLMRLLGTLPPSNIRLIVISAQFKLDKRQRMAALEA